METYVIKNYVIDVDMKQNIKIGGFVDVSLRSNRPNAKYVYFYSLLVFLDDTAKTLALRAAIHYKMKTKPNKRILIQSGSF